MNMTTNETTENHKGIRGQALVSSIEEYCKGSKSTPKNIAKGARKANCPVCGKLVGISGNYGVLHTHKP